MANETKREKEVIVGTELVTVVFRQFTVKVDKVQTVIPEFKITMKPNDSKVYEDAAAHLWISQQAKIRGSYKPSQVLDAVNGKTFTADDLRKGTAVKMTAEKAVDADPIAASIALGNKYPAHRKAMAKVITDLGGIVPAEWTK